MPLDPATEEEIRRLEEHMRRQPGSLVFARLADAYRRSGRTAEALALLDRGIARHAEYSSAHIVRARTCRALGRDDEARAGYLRVLDLDPRNLVALRELADMARRRGDAGEERSWVDRLAQADPSSPEHAERLAELCLPEEAVLPEEAGGARDKAGPAPAGEAGAPAREAAAEERVGRETADTVAAAQPEPERDPVPWWFEPPEVEDECAATADLLTRTMADLYARQGLYDDAEEIFRELLRDHPDDPELVRGLSDVHGMRDAARAARGPRAADPSPPPPDGPRAEVPGPEAQPGRDGEPEATGGRSGFFEEWLARLAASAEGGAGS